MQKKLKIITDAIKDLKGKEIITLEVTKITPEMSFIVIATGTSKQHIKSIANNVRQEVKLKNFSVRALEGEDTDWLLVDCGDMIVHIMTETSREFYSLEKLWSH
jgi:ribosome-associated protein